eukprot:c6453_g1_i1.p1 GENE.c6453_g1_i1~~c6453_g1_i1.p1  ORF type:complete len:271 (-),score=56.31 c6453_g1_i1:34-846(-)
MGCVTQNPTKMYRDMNFWWQWNREEKAQAPPLTNCCEHHELPPCQHKTTEISFSANKTMQLPTGCDQNDYVATKRRVFFAQQTFVGDVPSQAQVQLQARVQAQVQQQAQQQQQEQDNLNVTILHERLLHMHEKDYGKEHPLVATCLTNLAESLSQAGQYHKAIQLHKRALSIREATLGRTHPEVANSLTNIAKLCTQQGDYVNAIELHSRALKIYENIVSDDDSHFLEIALSLHNLAALLFDQQRYPEAVGLFQRALRILEPVDGASKSQ